MAGHRCPYRKRRVAANPPSLAGLALLCATVTGCSAARDLAGPTLTGPTVTGSLAPRADSAPAPQPMPPPVTSKAADQDSRSDWDTVKRTVAKAAAKAPSERIGWTNDETGNSGTISDLIVSKSRSGAACKGFSTTLASIDGVRLYRGQVCEEGRGDWTYTSVEPADAKQPGG